VLGTPPIPPVPIGYPWTVGSAGNGTAPGSSPVTVLGGVVEINAQGGATNLTAAGTFTGNFSGAFTGTVNASGTISNAANAAMAGVATNGAFGGNIVTNANGASRNLLIETIPGNFSVSLESGSNSVVLYTNQLQLNGPQGQLAQLNQNDGFDIEDASLLGLHANGNGNVYFDRNITSQVATASQFIGNLAGNATSATSAGIAMIASNLFSGAILTNVVVTNSTFYGNGPGLTNLIAAVQAGHTNVTSATSVVIQLANPFPGTNYSANFMSDTAAAILSSEYVTGKTPTNFTANFASFTGNIDWSAIYQTQ
jgi:hypothetical protein